MIVQNMGALHLLDIWRKIDFDDEIVKQVSDNFPTSEHVSCDSKQLSCSLIFSGPSGQGADQEQGQGTAGTTNELETKSRC